MSPEATKMQIAQALREALAGQDGEYPTIPQLSDYYVPNLIYNLVQTLGIHTRRDGSRAVPLSDQQVDQLFEALRLAVDEKTHRGRNMLAVGLTIDVIDSAWMSLELRSGKDDV